VGLLGFSEIKSKLERYCAYQERSIYEVEKKIRTFINQEEKVELLVSELTKDGFLNQTRFVESFIQGKVNLKRWGRQKIRMALIQHKIPKDLIDRGINGIPKQKYTQNLQALAEKKAMTLKSGLSEFEKKGKVLRFLSSKGYSSNDWDEIDFSSLFAS
jgi:regulatory protein